MATDDDETERGDSASANQDALSMDGDYVVRKHILPRTTLFSPLDVPEVPPPIDARRLEVLRSTKPRFSWQQWPEMQLVEDCWTGHASSKSSRRESAYMDRRDTLRASPSQAAKKHNVVWWRTGTRKDRFKACS